MLGGAPLVDMRPQALERSYAEAVTKAAQESADRLGRTEFNIEDQVRTILELDGGLRILAGQPEAGDGVYPILESPSDLWSTTIRFSG